MVEIYLLEQLVAFAECGTQVAAAEQLHITQPALSRSMRKLEAKLGVALFDRGTSKIALNATGCVAAEQARVVLEANRALEDRVCAYDRSLHSVSIGACAPMPLGEVLVVLQRFAAGASVTTQVLADDDLLLRELHDRRLQLVLLSGMPSTAGVHAVPILRERLCISVPPGHPLLTLGEVRFHDLANATILANGDSGFWIDLCRRKLPHAELLVQGGIDELSTLVDASALPVFSSDLTVARTGEVPGRMTLPIVDDDACVIYHLACLQSERERFAPLFKSVRAKDA